MAEIEVHKFCKKSSSKFNGMNWAFIAIILWIFVANEATFAKNSRQRSTKIGRNNNDDLLDSDGDFDLFGLTPDRWEDDLTEYHDHDIHDTKLKRVARSPFDEDIDEKEDSDEDDDEGDDETNGSEKKSTTPSVTTTSKVSNSSPVSIAKLSTHASTIDPSTKPTTDTSKIPPGSSSTLTIHVNSSVKPAPIPSISAGSGRALPPDFRPVSKETSSTHAPTINSSTKPTTDTSKIPPVSSRTPTIHVNSSVKPAPIPNFSAGPGRALPPGFRPPGLPGGLPSGIPLPPGRKPGPGGPPHGPGKIPPHLLKHLSAPKPPPKKGELYLPEDYNNLVIPKLNLGKLIGINSYSAVPVLVFLNIRSVRDIDESMETLTLDLDLVIEWVDGFLFDPISAITTRQADITLNPIFLKKIWRPDIYIDEIVKVKRTSLMNKPLKLKFNPSNGFISYTTRLTVQLSCDMLYFYYPADTHRCEFTFRSYSYFSKDMELSWLGSGVYLQDPYDPNFDLQVESIDHIKLPQTFRKLTNDTYDALRFTILARRKLSFHLVQTYLPSIFFIVITWLCFLVPARMVEARIGISMTTLLTLTSMFASVRESTPIVSYVKAIDTWMVFCIFFVFLTLLEFSIFVWLRARREDAEEKKLEHQRKLQDKRDTGHKDAGVTFERSASLESIELQKYERFAEFTEKFAFVIFSIVFTSFNVIYWTWLLVASDYFDWTVNSTLNADLD